MYVVVHWKAQEEIHEQVHDSWIDNKVQNMGL